MRFSVTILLSLLLAALFVFAGCDSDAQENFETVYHFSAVVKAPSDEPFERVYLVSDDNGVSTSGLVVTVDGGDVNVQKFQQSSNQVRARITYTPTSRVDDRLLHFSGKDDTGFDLTPFSSQIDVVGGSENAPLVTIDILTRDFESKEQVSGDLLHLSHLEFDFDTTLVSDGIFSARLPVGDYAVTLEPSQDKSPLARIFVTPEHLDDSEHNFIESGRVIDRDGNEVDRTNYGYITFGSGRTPGMISLRSDYTGFAEVVEDGEFVARMATQTSTVSGLLHFDTRRPVVFAVYTGSVTIDTCGPEFIATEAALGFHEQFVEHNLLLINSTQVGGNPYSSIERRVVDAVTLSDVIGYCDDGDSGFLGGDADRNVSLYWFNEGTDKYRLHSSVDGNTYETGSKLLISTKASSPMHALGAVSRAARDAWAMGPTTQADIPNGSVRDSQRSGSLPDKPFAPESVVQYEFDDRFVKVATAFGPWAQYQLNPVSGQRGKNVRLEP